MAASIDELAPTPGATAERRSQENRLLLLNPNFQSLEYQIAFRDGRFLYHQLYERIVFQSETMAQSLWHSLMLVNGEPDKQECHLPRRNHTQFRSGGNPAWPFRIGHRTEETVGVLKVVLPIGL